MKQKLLRWLIKKLNQIDCKHYVCSCNNGIKHCVVCKKELK